MHDSGVNYNRELITDLGKCWDDRVTSPKWSTGGKSLDSSINTYVPKPGLK